MQLLTDGFNDFISSGGVWSADNLTVDLDASMTAVVAYIGGQRITASAVTARAFTASKYTAIDLGVDGTIDYNEGTTVPTLPALAADHIRLAVIITDGTSTTTVFDRRNLSPLTIARCELTEGTTDILWVDTLPNKNFYEAVHIDNESASKIPALRFNNDSGANYTWRKSINGAADTTGTTKNEILGISTSGTREHNIYKIANIVDSEEKTVFGLLTHSGSAGVGSSPGKAEQVGKWVSGSGAGNLINRINIMNLGAGDFVVGSKLIVSGYN